MGLFQRLRPESALDRIRVGASLAACGSLFLQMMHVIAADPPSAWSAASLLALLSFCGLIGFTYLRRQPSIIGLWLEAPLLVTASAGLVDPLDTVGLILVVLAVQSLYGTQRGWLLRITVGMVSLPLAVAVTPVSTGRLLQWQSSGVLAILPQLVLVCVVMRAVYAAMCRQDLAGAREAVLARIGNMMLGASSLDQVRALGLQAADELVELSPGVVALFVRTENGHLTVFGAAGLSQPAVGDVLPLEVLSDPRSLLGPLAPAVKEWTVEELTPGRYRLLGGSQRMHDHVVDTFRAMAHQVLLAENLRMSADELQHQAYHDALTGLPNRALFFRRLTEAIDTSPPGTVALLNIDLDDFKQVNDTQGHAAGDETLVRVARILQEAGGPDALPARFGGDEFAVLLTNLSGAAPAEVVAAEICRRVKAPHQLSMASVVIGASVGVAVSAAHLTAGDLTRCADIAMYSAKARGKNRVEVFDPDKHGDIARLRTEEQHLRYAVERQEIKVAFRPYVDRSTGLCAGVDAVAAWEHPTLGTLQHAGLLELADRTDQFPAIWSHVVKAAGAGFAAVAAAEPMRMSIELPGRLLADDTAVDILASATAGAGLSSGQVMLVVPECEQLGDEAVGRQLHRLVASGFALGVTDFGTGTVPLTSLESLPLSQIRSDRAMVSSGAKKLAMVVSIARLFEAQTMVQAVGNAEQLAAAMSGSPDVLQGDHLAPAMTPEQLRQWLAAGPGAAILRRLDAAFAVLAKEGDD
ncbi:diguanylate cyclase domain-containing protein [Actinoplanes sp. TFC3]|uniref:diguanylate cyclase domain-containing protein n=1 Tax=Actinoplanes sp. TFC3 TaxID=1710355 RepID=UPI000B093B6E|nr:diguanylate cyclase [Actinoplanes sp. TFC3]